MSWDSYIDNIITNSNNTAENVCIIGLDGGAKWTTDAHARALSISHPEAEAIAKCFKNKDFSIMQASGVTVGGTKYQFLRSQDGKNVIAKKKDHGTLALQSTKQAIIIAKCAEGQQPGTVNKVVASMAEYLEGIGY